MQCLHCLFVCWPNSWLIHLHMSFMWYCDKARDINYQKMDFGFIGIIFCLGIFTQITLGKIVQIDNDVTYDNGGTQWFSTLKKRPIDAFLGEF